MAVPRSQEIGSLLYPLLLEIACRQLKKMHVWLLAMGLEIKEWGADTINPLNQLQEAVRLQKISKFQNRSKREILLTTVCVRVMDYCFNLSLFGNKSSPFTLPSPPLGFCLCPTSALLQTFSALMDFEVLNQSYSLGINTAWLFYFIRCKTT